LADIERPEKKRRYIYIVKHQSSNYLNISFNIKALKINGIDEISTGISDYNNY
jgi:hypothetical protein